MPTLPGSAVPPELPANPTLADLVAFIRGRAKLSASARDCMCCAIRTFAKAQELDLETTPARLGFLNAKLKGFVPAQAGLKARRWIDVRSLVLRALKLARVTQSPVERDQPLSPAWAQLVALLTDKRARLGLSRAIRLFSARGREPDTIGDADFDDLRAQIAGDWAYRDQAAAHRSACMIWNECAASIPDWPKQTVTVPSLNRSVNYKLPWTNFPPSFRADVELYFTRLSGQDLLADHDCPALRASSLKTRRFQLESSSAAFVHEGGDIASLKSLADLIQIPSVNLIMKFLLRRNDGKKSSQMFQIAGFLTSIARHWVQVDDDHLGQLKRLCKRLSPRSAGFSEKNQTRLNQFDDEENVRTLLRLPWKIVADVKKSKKSPHQKAILLQTALAIEILIMTQIRLKNLTNLMVGTHLTRTRAGRWNLNVPADEVKNSKMIKAQFPVETSKMIDLYLGEYWPALAKPNCKALFPGENGAKSEVTLGPQISRTILRITGLKMNPHFFRHFTANHYLEDNPGDYGTLRLALGHRSINTTTTFYCGNETTAAFKHVDEHVLRKRGVVALDVKRPSVKRTKKIIKPPKKRRGDVI